MQPMGMKPINFPNKTDCHPKKGFINWWEDIINPDFSKRSERQRVRKELQEIKICFMKND